jgi:hypothetical protein
VYEAIPCEEFVPAYFVLRARKLEGCYPIINLSGSWDNYLLYDDLKCSFNLIGFILKSHKKNSRFKYLLLAVLNYLLWYTNEIINKS